MVNLIVFFPTLMLRQNFTPAISAQNLGITFDNNIHFRQHISHTCLFCFYHIRDLRRFRRYMFLLPPKLLQLLLLAVDLITAIPFIIIGNCNIKDILKRQSVPNYLAWVVTQSPRFCQHHFLIALTPCPILHYF